MKNLIQALELQQDLKELRECGLTEEELQGYVDIFGELYLGEGSWLTKLENQDDI